MAGITRRSLLVASIAAAIAPLSSRAGIPGRLPLVEVASGVFVAQGQHQLFTPENGGHIANLTAIIGAHSVAVVDTGGSIAVGRAFLAAIRALSDLPVRYVINTHMHPDHVFGNAAFAGPDTVFAGHAKLPRALAARGERYISANRADLGPEAFEGTHVIAPTLLVEDRTSLDLGGRTITLVARKTSHTDNDLTVRDEATNTLILGDLLFSGHIPVIDGSIKGWLNLIGELRSEPAGRAIPGHGPASMPWPAALDDETRYLETIARDVRAIIKSGGTLEIAMRDAGQSEAANWVLFDQFHKRNIAAAFAELEWE